MEMLGIEGVVPISYSSGRFSTLPIVLSLNFRERGAGSFIRTTIEDRVRGDNYHY